MRLPTSSLVAAVRSAGEVLDSDLVLRPPKEQAFIVGLARTLGTTAGVVIGILVAGVVG